MRAVNETFGVARKKASKSLISFDDVHILYRFQKQKKKKKNDSYKHKKQQ